MIRVLEALNIRPGDTRHIHRWRYARVTQPHQSAFWLDADQHLGACGDWGVGATIEDAVTSALALNKALLPNLK